MYTARPLSPPNLYTGILLIFKQNETHQASDAGSIILMAPLACASGQGNVLSGNGFLLDVLFAFIETAMTTSMKKIPNNQFQ